MSPQTRNGATNTHSVELGVRRRCSSNHVGLLLLFTSLGCHTSLCRHVKLNSHIVFYCSYCLSWSFVVVLVCISTAVHVVDWQRIWQFRAHSQRFNPGTSPRLLEHFCLHSPEVLEHYFSSCSFFHLSHGIFCPERLKTGCSPAVCFRNLAAIFFGSSIARHTNGRECHQ